MRGSVFRFVALRLNIRRFLKNIIAQANLDRCEHAVEVVITVASRARGFYIAASANDC